MDKRLENLINFQIPDPAQGTNRVVTFFKELEAAVAAYKRVDSVTVSGPDTVDSAGGTFTAVVDGHNLSGSDLDVTWESSDTGVATISQSGVLTYVLDGETTVTATSVLDPSKSDSITVTVAA